MKHICVFLAYKNFEDIKISFESIYNNNIDFFIIENYSENSDKIKNYFITKRLIGYIQFVENIALNAINIFIKQFYDLLQTYDFITITDGDLYLYDSTSMFNEIIQNLSIDNVIISSCSLYKDNHYKYSNPIVGIDKYIENMKKRNVENGFIMGHTANNFITLKNENLIILKDLWYQDTNIKNKVKELNKLWVRTKNNLAYHLTWDLYTLKTPYYHWKMNVYPNIWKISKEAQYITII